MNGDIQQLAKEIGACRKCRDNPDGGPLHHEPRPVVVLSAKARIRIIGQAPGIRVHNSGRPFTDPSGDRLRQWMGLDEIQFYDPDILAITPMGFCFPGYDDKGGDLPPRKECAALWHDQVDQSMPQVELILLIGMYAQKRYLARKASKTLTGTVANWREIATLSSDPVLMPLPHPSWRNNAWLKKNPWFEAELLPELRKRIQDLI